MHRKCRLCLNTNQLIDLFHPLLFTAKQLRFYVLLCSGVNIKSSDVQSKYVCLDCCKVAIKFYNYRKSAMDINNEQRNELDVSATEQDSMSNNGFDAHYKDSFRLIYEAMESTPGCVIKEKTLKLHWSVIDLFKKFPKMRIPNQILNTHVTPVVVLQQINALLMKDKIDVYNNICPSRCKTSRREIPKKLRISRSETESDDNTELELSNTTPGKKSTQYRKRISSECSEIIPLKKKRLFTKESIAFHKIDLPEKQPSDVESKKMIFISSLELTPITCRTLPSNSILEEVEGKFTCSYCEKSYRNLASLKSHIRRHRKCVLCNKMCSAAKSLTDHLRDVCYKKLLTNQPVVRLKRETLNSPNKHNVVKEIVAEDCRRTTSTPNRNASDVKNCSVEVKNILSNECLPTEITYLNSIIKNYKDAVMKTTYDKKNKCSDSEWVNDYSKECKENHIILNNMFGELSVYICTP